MPRQRTHLSAVLPTPAAEATGNPETDQAVRNLQSQIDALNTRVNALAGPGQRPLGPGRVLAEVGHKHVSIIFTKDRAEASVQAYVIWAADAGDVGAPIVPSASEAVVIGTVAATWRRFIPGHTYSFVDALWSDADLTAPEAMRMYWVSTLDIRGRESALIPIESGPVAGVA